MKRSSMLTVLASASFIAMTATTADAQNGMKMSGMEMSGADSTQKEKLGHTTGKVVAINAARSGVTIAHHSVPALGWPAMTMAFQASSRQLRGIKTGDQVDFEFYMRGHAAVIEQIHRIG